MDYAQILFSTSINHASADWYDRLISLYHKWTIKSRIKELCLSTHGIEGYTLSKSLSGGYRFTGGRWVDEDSFQLILIGCNRDAVSRLANKITSELRQEAVLVVVSKPDIETVYPWRF